MSSTTPAPWAPSVTKSARSLSIGSAFATAAENSHRLRKAWSFSASPTPTTLCGERSSSSSAADRPVALFTPEGSTMTEPLLKMTCHSSPSSRIASRTATSCGSTVAMIAFPTESGLTPFFRIASTSAGGGASPSTFSSRPAGR